jgi:hypothetical protein
MFVLMFLLLLFSILAPLLLLMMVHLFFPVKTFLTTMTSTPKVTSITQDHWPACKAVLCFHAGTATSKLSTMTKVLKEAAMLELYLVSIDRLDPLVFCDGSRAFFKRSFRKKEDQVSPEHLYCYFLDSRRTMQSVIIPVFPKNLVSMKSGKGFHESCNEVYKTAYRQELLKLNIRGVPKYTPKW